MSTEVYVITDQSHVEHVREQLPQLDDVHCFIEPDRRGTASCILACLSQLQDRARPDEPIAFVAADHHVRDQRGFRQSFKLAERASRKYRRIVLIGVEPDRPATGFGYIEKGELIDEYSLMSNVAAFREKPDAETARDYLQSGNYLWNCGYFVGSLATFETSMEQYAPELWSSYQALLACETESDFTRCYLELVTQPIDTALIERVPNLMVLPASFDWRDLGSYEDLHQAAPVSEDGNYVAGGPAVLIDVQGTYVQNTTAVPIALIGLDNVVAVCTPEGILITRRDLSQRVKDVVAELHKNS